MNRESTMAAIFRYRASAGRWPRADALVGMLARRPDDVKARLDALEAQGYIQLSRDGRYRIVSGNAKANAETI